MKLWFNANDRLVIRLEGRDVHFQAVPHPNMPGLAHTMERLHSTVFHMQELSAGGSEYALKVMSTKRRGPQLVEICELLRSLRSVTGLESCDRLCLTRDLCLDTIQRYPDLEYAIVMPWSGGTTWSDAHAEQGEEYRSAQDRSPKAGDLSRWRCLQLATRLAEVLAMLERQQMAHCNLGPEKIMLSLDPLVPLVELVGLEGVYSAHLESRKDLKDSVPEYRHPNETQPGPASDRFAGALLIAEILSWYDDEIKSLFLYQSDSLFTVDELGQTTNPKFEAVTGRVKSHHADLAELLQRAWESKTPDEAPAMVVWLEALVRVSRTKIEYAWLRPPASPVVMHDERFWDPALSSGTVAQ